MPVSQTPLKLSALATGILSFAAAAVVPATEPDPTPAPAVTQTQGTPPAALPAGQAAADAAVELPTFRFGLWEYRRTLVRGNTAKPQVTNIKKCLDPGDEMRTKMEDLKKKGCQFAPLRRQKDRYISTWVCQTQNGALRFRDVLTVKDENAYQDVSETHSGQGVSQQKLEATRLGDCPGMGVGAPLLPTPKSHRPPPITPPATPPNDSAPKG
jgi:hypothetical protein